MYGEKNHIFEGLSVCVCASMRPADLEIASTPLRTQA